MSRSRAGNGGSLGWLSLAILAAVSFGITLFVATHSFSRPNASGPIFTKQNSVISYVAGSAATDAELEKAHEEIERLKHQLASARQTAAEAAGLLRARQKKDKADPQVELPDIPAESKVPALPMKPSKVGSEAPAERSQSIESPQVAQRAQETQAAPTQDSTQMPLPVASSAVPLALMDPRLPPVGGPPQPGICWKGFDFGFIREWTGPQHTKHMCNTRPQGDARLTCYSARHAHLSQPAAPHAMCTLDGGGWLDFTKMAPAQCPASRPGWKCDGQPVYHRFTKGFISSRCEPTPENNPVQHLSQDHLRDMFKAFQPLGATQGEAPPSDAWGLPSGPLALSPYGTGDQSPTAASGDGNGNGSGNGNGPPIVLAVTRERGEHANLFHATTDFINAFIALHGMGVMDGEQGRIAEQREAVTGKVGVLLLDEQAEGPFDVVWERVFAPRWGVRRPSVFKPAGEAGGLPQSGVGQHEKVPEAAKPMRGPQLSADRVLFVAPGYASAFFHQNKGNALCREPVRMYRAYRSFFLAGLGVQEPRPDPSAPLKVLFVSRRPYNKFVEHSSVGRQISNEDEVLAKLGHDGGRTVFGTSGAVVERVDFVHFTYEQQVQKVAETDVLVGMHGAALTHSLLLPPWGGVLEFWPKQKDMWRCFEHMTELASGNYARWANSDPRKFRSDYQGDYTEVDVVGMALEASRLAERVVGSRQTFAELDGD